HTRFSRDWSSDVCSSDLLPRPRRGRAEAFRTDGNAVFGGNDPGHRTAGEDAPPSRVPRALNDRASAPRAAQTVAQGSQRPDDARSEEHTSELQSREKLAC